MPRPLDIGPGRVPSRCCTKEAKRAEIKTSSKWDCQFIDSHHRVGSARFLISTGVEEPYLSHHASASMLAFTAIRFIRRGIYRLPTLCPRIIQPTSNRACLERENQPTAPVTVYYLPATSPEQLLVSSHNMSRKGFSLMMICRTGDKRQSLPQTTLVLIEIIKPLTLRRCRCSPWEGTLMKKRFSEHSTGLPHST